MNIFWGCHLESYTSQDTRWDCPRRLDTVVPICFGFLPVYIALPRDIICIGWKFKFPVPYWGAGSPSVYTTAFIGYCVLGSASEWPDHLGDDYNPNSGWMRNRATWLSCKVYTGVTSQIGVVLSGRSGPILTVGALLRFGWRLARSTPTYFARFQDPFRLWQFTTIRSPFYLRGYIAPIGLRYTVLFRASDATPYLSLPRA